MQAKQREMAENAWTVVMGFAPLSSFNWKFCKTVHQIHLLLARQSLGFRLQTSVVGQFFDLFFGWVGFWNVSKNQKAYYDERTNNLMQVSLWILWLFENQRLWWVKAGSSKTKNCCFFFLRTQVYIKGLYYTPDPSPLVLSLKKERTAQHQFRWPTSISVNKTLVDGWKGLLCYSEKSLNANLGHPMCSDEPQPAYHVMMISSQTKQSIVPPNELHPLFLCCF
jgi:hypothetical protein